jgi:ribosomal protein S18 acetylase RimI-like enzyme
MARHGGGDARQSLVVHVRELAPADAARCDEIIASLPYFFGVEAGVRACAEAVRTQRGWVALRDGLVLGFMTVEYPLPASPEISWLAVHATARHGGLGTALVAHAAHQLRAEGAALLSVLTLADSEPEVGVEDNYSGTRAFYRSAGFHPVRELRPPGWQQQALLLVRPLCGEP